MTSEQGLGSIPGVKQVAPLFLKVLFQSRRAGAEPTLYAATAADPGSYTGPQRCVSPAAEPGPAGLRWPARRLSEPVRDRRDARRDAVGPERAA